MIGNENQVVISNLETPIDFAEAVIHLPSELQNEFFAVLKDQLSEEDWLATVRFVSTEGLFRSVAKYKAMKEAVKAQVIEEFYGHPYEAHETKCFDDCITVYGIEHIGSLPVIYRPR